MGSAICEDLELAGSLGIIPAALHAEGISGESQGLLRGSLFEGGHPSSLHSNGEPLLAKPHHFQNLEYDEEEEDKESPDEVLRGSLNGFTCHGVGALYSLDHGGETA